MLSLGKSRKDRKMFPNGRKLEMSQSQKGRVVQDWVLWQDHWQIPGWPLVTGVWASALSLPLSS